MPVEETYVLTLKMRYGMDLYESIEAFIFSIVNFGGKIGENEKKYHMEIIDQRKIIYLPGDIVVIDSSPKITYGHTQSSPPQKPKRKYKKKKKKVDISALVQQIKEDCNLEQ